MKESIETYWKILCLVIVLFDTVLCLLTPF